MCRIYLAVAVQITKFVSVSTDITVLLEQERNSILQGGRSHLLAGRKELHKIVAGEHG